MQCVVHDVVAHLGLAGIAVVSKGNRHKLEWPVRFPFYYSAHWLLWRVDIHLLSPSHTLAAVYKHYHKNKVAHHHKIDIYTSLYA